MNNSQITIKISPYDLKLNNNKRLLVFNKGVFVKSDNITVHKNSMKDKQL